MIEIRGKWNTAKVFTDNIDDTAIAQIMEMCSRAYLKAQKIRIMPDVHAGKGCTIGTTMTVDAAVCPSYVGVDIGCGMEVTVIQEKDVDPQKLDQVIRRFIPAGTSVRQTAHPFVKQAGIENLRCAKEADLDRAMLSLGTLGGGNHFIELDRDEEGTLYLVIHSGSRQLGVNVAQFYQKAAISYHKSKTEQKVRETIEGLKRAGQADQIQSRLEAIRKEAAATVGTDPDFCEGSLLDDYLHDMKITQHYAMLNRKAMSQVIVKEMGWTVTDSFTTIHNYIDLEYGILRKGAVSAREGERLIIPINMRDGSLICIGKGNDDWNQSAPHGAGRLFSRSEANSRFTLEEYQKEMAGVWSTSVSNGTIDECPMAYKPMEEIIANIQDTVEIERVIRPVYNFKAS